MVTGICMTWVGRFVGSGKAAEAAVILRMHITCRVPTQSTQNTLYQ